jgi:hypothetical protein
VAPPSSPSGTSVDSDTNSLWPSLVKRPGQDPPHKSVSAKKVKKRNSPKENASSSKGNVTHISLNSEESTNRAETASTNSFTNTLRSSTTIRMIDLEKEMQACRELLRNSRAAAEDSSARLSATETSLRATVKTISEMALSVTDIQTQMANLTLTLESMRLTIHTMAHQTRLALPQVPLPPLPATAHLPTILESAHSPGLNIDCLSLSSDGTTSCKSPEKKKSRARLNNERTVLSEVTRNESVDEVTLQLFSDFAAMQDVTATQEPTIQNPQPNTSTTRSTPVNQPSHHHTPSPPDAQYTKQSDPAGREEI